MVNKEWVRKIIIKTKTKKRNNQKKCFDKDYKKGTNEAKVCN